MTDRIYGSGEVAATPAELEELARKAHQDSRNKLADKLDAEGEEMTTPQVTEKDMERAANIRRKQMNCGHSNYRPVLCMDCAAIELAAARRKGEKKATSKVIIRTLEILNKYKRSTTPAIATLESWLAVERIKQLEEGR